MTKIYGGVTLLYAALVLLLGITPSVLLDGGEPMAQWVLDPAWGSLSVIAFLAAMLAPFVLIGLFIYQRPRIGKSGAVGLFLSVVGMLVYLGFQFDLAFVWPVLATENPALLDFEGPMFRSPIFAFVHLWMGPLTSLGILTFGIATYRAKVFPRWSAVLFLMGFLLIQGILFPPLVLRLIGSFPAAIALLVMGFGQMTRDVPESGGVRPR